VDSVELKKLLTKRQGELEESLKQYGGKKTEDLTKEDVFAWMKWKAQWELVTELIATV
jgi:hypothetical protein